MESRAQVLSRLTSWPVLLVMLAGALISVPGRGERLPEPQGLETRVAFWIDVYTQYTTRQAVLHDSLHPEVIYGVVDLGGPADGGLTPYPESDKEIMELARERVRALLRHLEAHGDAGSLTDEERLVRDAAALLPEPGRYREAEGRVRSQRGLADRFRQGLTRSGFYLLEFRRLARQEGVPEDLAYLPHVESSFQIDARSHVGAAGLWQFMRSTGRLFLTIDASVDERLDPWIAARAAFRLLRANHEALGSWPLAVTAYNHGQAGMLRAQRRHGDDLARIIDEYESRSFGFASRSFYAEFLAARRIASQPEIWFGPLQVEAPARFEAFTLPDFVAPRALGEHLGLPLEALMALNPAVAAEVWAGKELLPRGYELRLPTGRLAQIEEAWDTLPASVRFERRLHEAWHKVRRGENLSKIAHLHGTSVSALARMNHLSSNLIRPGQRLKVRQASEWVPLVSTGESSGLVVNLTSAVASLLRHVVQKGETLTGIGLRYGIQVSLLMQANGLSDASRIQAGQVLLIPAGN